MSWWELALASRYPEFAEEVLLAQGAASVTFSDCADDPVLEPAPGETPLWPRTRTRGLFADAAQLDAACAALHEQLPDGAGLAIERRAVEDRDWVAAWLSYAQPLRFGDAAARGLWICPSGHRVDEPDAVVVELDPGLAFGTGTHPSTALCLDWLARHEIRDARVLDYGCGSGILGIAAARLGAKQILAVDIDPQALTATRDNAQRNGVADRFSCATGDEDVFASRVDLVLANILARPLIALAPMLAARCTSGAHIVLAGILNAQTDEVRAAYAPWFDFDSDARREGWSRISGTRRA